jgi:histidine phosphotransferase ChpT
MALMPVLLDLRVCELLAARLCHDLAGPIAAIANGAELLDDEDADFARDAAKLIGGSADTAVARLQLFRFVYGFSQGTAAGPPPQALATGYFAGTAIACDCPAALGQLDMAWQRLGCLLLVVGGEGLPRGGRLALEARAGAVAVSASGEGEGPSAEARDALALATPVEALTSRTVGAYFAGVLAKTLGYRVTITVEPGGFHIACEALAAPSSGAGQKDNQAERSAGVTSAGSRST